MNLAVGPDFRVEDWIAAFVADRRWRLTGNPIDFKSPVVQKFLVSGALLIWLVDAVAQLRPHMPEVGAPAQLEHELVLGVQRMARLYGGKHLGQAQKTVGQVGRQPGDCTVQRMRVRA